MKITFDSNIYSPGEIGDITGGPTIQKGTETTTIFKTHFFSLGEMAKIHEIKGKVTNYSIWDRLFLNTPIIELPISRYSLDVSIWKVVVFILLVIPVTFIQAAFNGKAVSAINRTVIENKVTIEIITDKTGKASIKTEKIPPSRLFNWG